MKHGKRPCTRESGQAAVESALTLPLVVFLFLGTLQLFLALQARIMTQYAVFRAVRSGSVNHADCEKMMDAAVGVLLPTFSRTDSAATLAESFRLHKRNGEYRYREVEIDGARGGTKLGGVSWTGDIAWIFQNMAGTPPPGVQTRFDGEFDQGTLTRLEARLVFWYPMRIPFANWVINAMVRAHYGVASYTNANPLLLAKKNANWNKATSNPTMDAQIADEYRSRSSSEYILPISATYSMRMMTPGGGTSICKSAN